MRKQRSNQLHFLTFVTFSVCTVLSCDFVNCLVINDCDKTQVTIPDITEEEITLRGEYPFVVALYEIKKDQFFCGGTLISNKHVLTAAHCVQPHPDEELLSDDVVVYLRVYNLLHRFESGRVQRGVQEIHLHDKWNSASYIKKEEYDADIALMVLNDTVSFTKYIRPVCMPADDAYIYGARGSVIRWGLTENGIQEKFLRRSLINSSNASYCYTEGNISSLSMFCGGSGGDSGSGFFVLSGSAWVQYGITSALRTSKSNEQNPITIYTNLKHFKSWIFDIVKQTGGTLMTVDKSYTTRINLNCDYSIYTPGYSCWVNGLDVRNENVEVVSINGTHQKRTTDEDVEVIQFRSGTMLYLPNEIGKFFENLKYIWISGNFYTMENLVDLTIDENDIQNIEEDSLWDLPNLEFFYLVNNKLSILEERTFHSNKKLRQVTLTSNQLTFLPKYLFKNNLLLEWVYFNDNLLKVIETEFNVLTNIKRVAFLDNSCIDLLYDGLGNLTEFQDFVREQCGTASS